MKIQEISTQEFLKRLEVVYGDDAKRQQERYLSLAESFKKDFFGICLSRAFIATSKASILSLNIPLYNFSL